MYLFILFYFILFYFIYLFIFLYLFFFKGGGWGGVELDVFHCTNQLLLLVNSPSS